jgi:hypothetical protein
MERTHGEKGKVRYSIGGYVTTQTLHSIAVNRTVAYLYRLFARIWEKRRFAGILRFCEFGYTRFHEGERLDASTGLAWV